MLKLGSHPKVYKCSFCGKPDNQVEKLIAGPDGVYICDGCINLTAELLNIKLKDEDLTGAEKDQKNLFDSWQWTFNFNDSQNESKRKLKSTPVCKCSFCGKSESQVEKLVESSKDVYICGECTKLCLEILNED